MRLLVDSLVDILVKQGVDRPYPLFLLFVIVIYFCSVGIYFCTFVAQSLIDASFVFLSLAYMNRDVHIHTYIHVRFL